MSSQQNIPADLASHVPSPPQHHTFRVPLLFLVVVIFISPVFSREARIWVKLGFNP